MKYGNLKKKKHLLHINHLTYDKHSMKSRNVDLRLRWCIIEHFSKINKKSEKILHSIHIIYGRICLFSQKAEVLVEKSTVLSRSQTKWTQSDTFRWNRRYESLKWKNFCWASVSNWKKSNLTETFHSQSELKKTQWK